MTPDEMKAKAWKFLRSQGLTEEGTAGLMDNLERESGEFYSNRGSLSCYWRKNRNYKWIAVWAPTS